MAEKDYNAIARKVIYRPAAQNNKPKILIYARNKKGKTTFSISAGVEKTLVLDPENGTEEMRKKNPYVWPISTWEDVDDAYNYLKYGNHPYEWVSVDGLTRFSNMALKYVMKLEEDKSLVRIPGMVQLKDYGKANELMKDFLMKFHNLPMGVIYTCQERQADGGGSEPEEDDDAEDSTVVYIPDLPKGVRNAVNALVGVIGRLYVVRLQPEDGGPIVSERRLWLGESTKYDTGARSEYNLPDMIRNPTVPKLMRLIRTGTTAIPKK